MLSEISVDFVANEIIIDLSNLVRCSNISTKIFRLEVIYMRILFISML
jgi:hypothetical protein